MAFSPPWNESLVFVTKLESLFSSLILQRGKRLWLDWHPLGKANVTKNKTIYSRGNGFSILFRKPRKSRIDSDGYSRIFFSNERFEMGKNERNFLADEWITNNATRLASRINSCTDCTIFYIRVEKPSRNYTWKWSSILSRNEARNWSERLLPLR